MKRQYSQRIWELDAIKGIALILMLYFHLVYDLDVIFQYDIDSSNLLNSLTAKASGSLFILTAGISSYLTKDNGRRALKVLAFALLLTLITYLYDPGMIITFGILHLIGSSILLGMLFKRLHPLLLILLGLIILFATPWLVSLPHPQNLLLFPLGIAPEIAGSSDYYPLLPWFGVFLLGNALGKSLYREKRSLFSIDLSGSLLCKAGRKTLMIYLIHQPVLIGIIYAIRSIAGAN